MHYVIIGGSAAGLSAIEAIRSVDKKCDITLISREEYPLYSRCLLTYYIAGSIDKKGLNFRPDDFFKMHKVDAKLGKEACGIDIRNREISIKGARSRLSFDKLLLATGSEPKHLGIPGEDKAGVFNVRTIKDAEGILKHLKGTQKVVLLGGGLIGMRTAYALRSQGKEITVVVKSRQILSQILDGTAADILKGRFEREGVRFIFGLNAKEIIGADSVEGALLEDGSRLDCQMVIVGKGVRPNIGLAEDAGIKANEGILLNDYLQTDVEDIFAAGDCCETRDIATGELNINAIWPAAVAQGRIAGLNMLGKKTPYEGSLAMNSLDIFGLAAISMGKHKAGEKEAGFEELIRLKDDGYKKVVLKEGRIVGGIFIGDIGRAGIIGKLIRSRVDVSSIRDKLLDDDFDFAKLLPLVRDEVSRFSEREFREAVCSY